MGNNANKIEQCKRQAKRIKSDYPELGYMQRLDVVAKQMGYQHYTNLVNLTEKQ